MKKLILDKFSTILFTTILISYLASIIMKFGFLVPILKYLITGLILVLLTLQITKADLFKKNDAIFMPFILFICLYIFRINDSEAIMIVINQITLLLFSFMLYRFNWKTYHIKIFTSIFYVLLPIILLSFIKPDITVNKNTLSGIILYTSMFPLLYIYGYNQKPSKIKLFTLNTLIILLLLLTGSRSTILALLIGGFTFIAWNKITVNKFINSLYFFLVGYIIYFITVIYPKIDQYAVYPMLNEWSIKLFSKPLLTGRDNIWRNSIRFIKEGPFLGYGSSVSPEDFYQTKLSSHNLYLQTGLQVGILGVVLLALFFFTIWTKSQKVKNNQKVRILSSFLIITAVHQTFEVTLTQNQFSVALMQWMVIGFLISEIFTSNENEIKIHNR